MQYESALDKHLQENSIMYKGTPGNVYNTTMDEYYIQKDGYSYQSGPGGGGNDDCQPCYNPNPPWWCSDPTNPCYDASVPIEPGILGVVFCFLFGTLLILKHNEKIKSI